MAAIHAPRLLTLLLVATWLVACTDSGSPGADPGLDATGDTSGEPSETAAGPPSSGPTAGETAEDPWVGAWRDVTATALGTTADWTNKVELADLDTDGDVDLLFANGGDYESPGQPVANRVFLNDGSAAFSDATRAVFGRAAGLTRVIKVVDVNADSVPDIVVGTTFQTQSRLYLGDGHGGWRDVTDTHLPQTRLSVGDLEPGDVDADGDLDLVLADWGPGSPMRNDGGRVALWLNDGSGRFTDATAARMPATEVRFSWELELIDADNDWDLDIATSCKMCESSLLYDNRGGSFVDVTAERMPHFTNNYEFTPLDLDADGYLDLVTTNDGENTGLGLAEHVFRNDAGHGFVDATAQWWPPRSNTGWDDNVVVGLDAESDGDVDFVIGSLDGPDRLLLNDGAGVLTVHDDVLDGTRTHGTLGIALADLDGDRRVDLVESQGEAEGFEDERVYLATSAVPPDGGCTTTAPPTSPTTGGASSSGRPLVTST